MNTLYIILSALSIVCLFMCWLENKRDNRGEALMYIAVSTTCAWVMCALYIGQSILNNLK